MRVPIEVRLAWVSFWEMGNMSVPGMRRLPGGGSCGCPSRWVGGLAVARGAQGGSGAGGYGRLAPGDLLEAFHAGAHRGALCVPCLGSGRAVGGEGGGVCGMRRARRQEACLALLRRWSCGCPPRGRGRPWPAPPAGAARRPRCRPTPPGRPAAARPPPPTLSTRSACEARGPKGCLHAASWQGLPPSRRPSCRLFPPQVCEARGPPRGPLPGGLLQSCY